MEVDSDLHHYHPIESILLVMHAYSDLRLFMHAYTTSHACLFERPKAYFFGIPYIERRHANTYSKGIYITHNLVGMDPEKSFLQAPVDDIGRPKGQMWNIMYSDEDVVTYEDLEKAEDELELFS